MSVEHAVEEGWKHPSSIISERTAVYAMQHALASSAIRSASTPFPPTRTTASRPRARSRTFRSAACARPPSSSPRPSSSRRPRRRPTWRSGGSTPTIGDAIVARRRRDPRRRAARSVRRRRLPGRRRHVAQHERQRGARQPRRRAARRRARRRTRRVHPNDHVNMGQSTNDVFPTATRLALLLEHRAARRRGARAGRRRSSARRDEFADVLKVGRTHLQDAVPMTLGQEFSGYAACIERGADDVEHGVRAAEGAEPRRDRGRHRTERRRRLHDARRRPPRARTPALPVAPAANLLPRHAEHGRRRSPTRARCGGWRSSSARSRATCGCSAWGRAPGIAEIALPAVQPGSSIMPGKVNPSVPEMVNQVCFQVIGCDATVCAAAEAGQLELNVMMPVIAWNALHASTHPARGDDGAAHAHASTASRPTPSAAASCSIAAPRSPPRSARTSATRRPPRSRRSRCATGRPIRELVLERGLMDAAAARRDPVGRGDDAAGHRGGDKRMMTRSQSTLALGGGRRRHGARRPPRLARSRRRGRATAVCFRPRISGCSKRPTATRGRSPTRSWTRSASPTARRSPTSAPAPAGSRSGWRARRPERHWSTRRTCSGRCSRRSSGACSARGCRTCRRGSAHGSDPNLPGQGARRGADRRRLSGGRRIASRFLRNLARALKPNGRIGIVNYKPGRGGPGPDSQRARRQRRGRGDARAAGLRVLAQREPALSVPARPRSR